MPLVTIAESSRGSDLTLGSIVLAIGTPNMDSVTLATLYQHAAVEHYATYKILDDSLVILGAGSVRGSMGVNQGLRYVHSELWRTDPTISRARTAADCGETSVIHVIPNALPPQHSNMYAEHYVCDRVFVCGNRSAGRFGISMLKCAAHGAFDDVELAWIRESSDILISSLSRHAELTGDVSTSELPAVHEIELRLQRHSASLTRRETQVCARVLRGISTAGVAIDLGIGEESVTTYRRRAYSRLGISSHFKLLEVLLRLG